MSKRVRPAKRYQRADNAVRQAVMRAKPVVAKDLREAFRHLRDLVPKNMRLNDRHTAIKWSHFGEVLKKPFARIGKAYESGAALGVQKINGAFAQAQQRVRFRKGFGMNFVKAADTFNFDLYTPEVQQALRDAQDALIQQLIESSRDAIEQVVMAGALEGLSAADLVDDIRAVIGLTDTQAQAVMNYQAMLQTLDPTALERQLRNTTMDQTVQDAIDAGDFLPADTIDQMVQDYADNYLTYRASTIAQTESVRAVNAGLHDSYSQAIDRGVMPDSAVKREWELGDSPCFPAGTMILTNTGDIPIEMINGGSVWTRRGWRKVRATLKRQFEGKMVALKTKTKLLLCTDSHPIFVNGGWCRAIDINLDDTIQLADHQSANVCSILKFGLCDANGAPAKFGKGAVATRVFGRIGVPISAVKLQSNAFCIKREVNRISSNLQFLGINCAKRIESNSDLSFWNSFSLKSSVAFETAKLPVVIRWFASKIYSATAAFNNLRRHIAISRAILRAFSFGTAAKHFAASGALMFGVGELVGIEAIDTAKFSSFGDGCVNNKRLAASDAADRHVLARCNMITDGRAIMIDAIQPLVGCDFDAAMRAIIGEWHDGLCLLQGRQIVYDLEIEGEHEFFANGILVHNCPICESIPDLNTDGVGVDEEFESDDGPVDDPPIHPNCMCSVNYITDISQIPDDTADESGSFDTANTQAEEFT